MSGRKASTILVIVMLLVACVAPSGSPGSATPSSSGAVLSPSASTVAPTPTLTPSLTPTPTATPTPTPTTAPTRTPQPQTMIVRAYFLLDDAAGGDPALVPVLRTVPKSKATAKAAMRMLLAGPSAKERAANPRLRTTIPSDTGLRGINISDGLATVDLSADFASGGGSFSVRGRLAQVVYTMTQFSTVDRVEFRLDGNAVTVFSSEGIILRKPVTRATYREDFLPPIFVDRPAWGAALLSAGHVTGVANVFEAQFRVAVLDRRGRVLVDRPVKATAGTGTWGRFDVTLSYDVSMAQWGTLRVWDDSERDGSVESLREYPIYLRPSR
jgi:spore germination protein GerM